MIFLTDANNRLAIPLVLLIALLNGWFLIVTLRLLLNHCANPNEGLRNCVSEMTDPLVQRVARRLAGDQPYTTKMRLAWWLVIGVSLFVQLALMQLTTWVA